MIIGDGSITFKDTDIGLFETNTNAQLAAIMPSQDKFDLAAFDQFFKSHFSTVRKK